MYYLVEDGLKIILEKFLFRTTNIIFAIFIAERNNATKIKSSCLQAGPKSVHFALLLLGKLISQSLS